MEIEEDEQERGSDERLGEGTVENGQGGEGEEGREGSVRG